MHRHIYLNLSDWKLIQESLEYYKVHTKNNLLAPNEKVKHKIEYSRELFRIDKLLNHLEKALRPYE